jgi:hypothetical protein
MFIVFLKHQNCSTSDSRYTISIAEGFYLLF